MISLEDNLQHQKKSLENVRIAFHTVVTTLELYPKEKSDSSMKVKVCSP